MASPGQPLEADMLEPRPLPSPEPSETDETEPRPPPSPEPSESDETESDEMDEDELDLSKCPVSWSNARECDSSGKRPSVSINKSGVVVVVYKRGLHGDLRYRVGKWTRDTYGYIEWGDSHKFDSGIYPSVAINDNGTVVEVHESQWRRALFYRVGTVEEEDMTITWAEGSSRSTHYSSGSKPSVALNNVGEVVEVHMTDRLQVNNTNYCVGTLQENSAIKWSDSLTYGEGTRPQVAINDKGTVVEVHELVQPKETTACIVGHFQKQRADIEWGPTTILGSGSKPCIALNNNNQVVEVHQRGFRNLLFSGGMVHLQTKATIGLCGRKRYQKYKLCDGISPTVSMNDDGNISFACETSSQFKHTLLCHTGTWAAHK